MHKKRIKIAKENELKKRKIKFRGEQQSKRGIFSFIIAIFVVVSFIVLSLISSMAKGAGGIELGAIGLLCFAFAIYGFLLAIKATKEKDIFYKLPIASMILNGLFIILYFVLYLIGF